MAGAPRRASRGSGGGPPGIGATVLLLLAEESVPRIVRALRPGPLSTAALRQRLPDLAPATLDKRLVDARGAKAVSRHPPAGPGQPSLHRLTDLGQELHTLFGSAHRWVVQGPGSLTDEPGRLSVTSTILGLLADGTGRAMLHAVDEGTTQPARLEHQLWDATHGTVGHLIDKQEVLRLLGRDGPHGERRRRRLYVTTYGREAVAFVSLAARLEDRFEVPGSVPPAPVEAARLLRFAVPLLEPETRERGAVRVVIEPHPKRPAEPASFLLRTGDGTVLAMDSTPAAPVSAEARAPVPRWCDAIVRADGDQLQISGNEGLARRLLEEFHGRLFGSLGPFTNPPVGSPHT